MKTQLKNINNNIIRINEHTYNTLLLKYEKNNKRMLTKVLEKYPKIKKIININNKHLDNTFLLK